MLVRCWLIVSASIRWTLPENRECDRLARPVCPATKSTNQRIRLHPVRELIPSWISVKLVHFLSPWAPTTRKQTLATMPKLILASCIMLGAAIEGYLVLLISTFTEQAFQTPTGKKRKNKNLLKWDLGELIDVARELSWLPSQILPHPLVDTREVKDTASTDSIRKLRNLIHPGRLVKTRGGTTITKQELDTLHEIYVSIFLHLAKRAESLEFG